MEKFLMFLSSRFIACILFVTLWKVGNSQKIDSVDINVKVKNTIYDESKTIILKRKKFNHIQFKTLDKRYEIVAFYMRSIPDLGGLGDIIPSVLIVGNEIDNKFSQVFKKREFGTLKTSEILSFSYFYIIDKRTSEMFISTNIIFIKWKNSVAD